MCFGDPVGETRASHTKDQRPLFRLKRVDFLGPILHNLPMAMDLRRSPFVKNKGELNEWF